MDPSQPAGPGLGLSTAEAESRLRVEGFNELPASGRRTPLRIVIEVLKEPMLALLLGAGAIYLLLGDLREAIILIIFATVSVLITVIQESRTERVLEALRDLTSPRALVIRDGARIRIAGREVVRGDLVVLAEGDRVPADALLRDGQDFQADESLLTGESVPVRKIADRILAVDATQRPGGENHPYVFSGSLVVRGAGIAEVFATGSRSEIGKIGQTLRALEIQPPRLQAEVRRIVRVFASVGAVVSALVVLLYGFLRGGWLDAVLAGIAVGMSMLPEEFPVVLTVFMAMGAWRISRARVLTRRAAAIETLGSATVLCTDKTGTLTQNRMAIAEVRLRNGEIFRPQDLMDAPIPEPFDPIIELGIQASAVDPHDPMEKAFHELGKRRRPETANVSTQAGTPVRTYGLRPDLLAMSNAWATPDSGATFIVATKGAPETIADLCHLGADERASVTEAVNAMADQGMRVLGIAHCTFSGPWPDSQRDFALQYVGLVGLADPLRPGVPEAVAQCRSAGIRIVMITGDYPATARAIAGQAGLDTQHVLIGGELKGLSEAALAERVKTTTVFARIMPDQKLRIVEALKANGDVVAMTGDGVNDALSLKAADIGVAMGGRGTDVAREASSIVLLDDDFGSIVKAVILGRRIYDNLRKATVFIIAVHIPIAGLALLPLLLGFPLLLGPMHIAFLEMVIDPVCSLVFEAEREEDDIMRRPPRDPGEPLLSRPLLVWGLLQGGCTLLLISGLFFVAYGRDMPEAEVRALTFFALVFSIVSLVLVNRAYSASIIKALVRRNVILGFVLAGVTVMLVATLQWPLARELFHFGPLHAADLAAAAATGTGVLVLLEAAKRRRRITRKSNDVIGSPAGGA